MHPSYDSTVPLVPHGVAVSMTAPAVFNFTAISSPDRHREAVAVFMGDRAGDLSRVKDEDLGAVIRDELQRFLELVELPRGLEAIGYRSEDISAVRLREQYQRILCNSCGFSWWTVACRNDVSWTWRQCCPRLTRAKNENSSLRLSKTP